MFKTTQNVHENVIGILACYEDITLMFALKIHF